MEEQKESVFTVKCDVCNDFEDTAKTEPAAKAKLTRHINETHNPAVPLPEEKDGLAKKVEELTAAVAKLTENEGILREKLQKKEAVISPESGPGPACEAYKVHMGEALVLRKIEGDDRYSPVPADLIVRERDGTPFLVKKDAKPNEFTSNCRSMYTEPYIYKGVRKPGQTEYPEYEAHLCKKHANTLLGKSLEGTEGNLTVEQTSRA